MSIYNKKLLTSISKAAKVKIRYGTMLVGTPTKMRAVAKALAKRNIRVNITLDWI